MKGLRLKSAAHIKDFFERTNCGLVVSASCAGVSKDMADLRRRLRDETSAVVPDVRAPASPTQPVVAATKAAPMRQLAPAMRKPAAASFVEAKTEASGPCGSLAKDVNKGSNFFARTMPVGSLWQLQ